MPKKTLGNFVTTGEMMKSPLRFYVFFVCATLAATGSNARADTTLTYNVQAAARSDTGTFNYAGGSYNEEGASSSHNAADLQSFNFNSSLTGVSTLSSSPGAGWTLLTPNTANNAAAANAAATVDYGVLRMNVSGSGTTDVGKQTVVWSNPEVGTSSVIAENTWAAFGGGTIEGSWSDVLTLASSPLPTGSPVEVEVGYYFHAKVGQVGWPDPCVACLPVSEELPYAYFNDGAGDQWAVNSWETGEASFSTSLIFSRTVGSSLGLSSSMIVRGGGTAYGAAGDVFGGPRTALDSSGFADASSTGLISVRILTPGVYYTSASGTLYPESLPVPEPNNSILLSFGIAAISLARRFNSKRPV